MIKELDLMPQQGSFITSLRIRQDIPFMIKHINQMPNCVYETKLPELSFDGFVEFLLQYAHQLWNMTQFANEKPLLAIELSERLLEHIRQVNESKRLMIPTRHFHGQKYLLPGNQQEQELL